MIDASIRRPPRGVTSRVVAAMAICLAVLLIAGEASDASTLSGLVPVRGGMLVVGGALHAYPGTWGGSSSPLVYRWIACSEWPVQADELDDVLNHPTGHCALVGTGRIHTLTSIEQGRVVVVLVTVTTSDGGTRTIPSEATNSERVAASGSLPYENVASPSLVGAPEVGQIMEVNEGLWYGPSDSDFSFVARRCQPSTLTCEPISPVTGESLTPINTFRVTESEAGKELLASVAVRTNPSTTWSYCCALTPRVYVPPTAGLANIAAPVAGGLLSEGGQLVAHPGTWTGAPARPVIGQWKRCADLSTPIDLCAVVGAGEKYLTTSADNATYLTYEVTATASDGSTAKVWSRRVGPIGAATSTLQLVERPLIFGVPAVNNVLEATEGLWRGAATTTFVFRGWRCDHDTDDCIPGPPMASVTYQLQPDDGGKDFYAEVVAKEPDGQTLSATSDRIYVPPLPLQAPPSNTSPPTISGDSSVGSTLQASPGTWDGGEPITYSYQWRQCTTPAEPCSDITGAVESTYMVRDTDIGKQLAVHVVATNSAGSAEESSAETATVQSVAGAPMLTSAPTVTGSTQVGSTLQASSGGWDNAVAFRYQWQQCLDPCEDIPGASAASYVVLPTDVPNRLRVLVTATSPSGTSASGASGATDNTYGDPSDVEPATGCPETGIFVAMWKAGGSEPITAYGAKNNITNTFTNLSCIKGSADPEHAQGGSGHTARIQLGAKTNNWVEVGVTHKICGILVPTFCQYAFFEYAIAKSGPHREAAVSCLDFGRTHTWYVKRVASTGRWGGWLQCGTTGSPIQIPNNNTLTTTLVFDSGVPEGEGWERGATRASWQDENPMAETHSALKYQTAIGGSWLAAPYVKCRRDGSFRSDPDVVASATDQFTIVESHRTGDPRKTGCPEKGY